MPLDQKSDTRPISFVLHDTNANAQPIRVPLVIRPEDLTRNDTSRMSVNQTLSGAWVDSFGPGVSTVTISGHTGWGAGGRPDGFQAFQKLHTTVFDAWHKARADAANAGKDPDGVRLVFVDGLDGFTWVVAPQSFVLKRNKSRPLLSQYQISMVKLGDTVEETPKTIKPTPEAAQLAGLASLTGSINAINGFADNLKGQIASALGPIVNQVKAFVKLTGDVLSSVKQIVETGKSLVRSVTGPLLSVASGLCQAGRNIMATVSQVRSLPSFVKTEFMRVGSAFHNVHCLLRNVFQAKAPFPDYSSVFGASTCSSTAGGSSPSPFATAGANVFSEMFGDSGMTRGPRVAAAASGLSAVNALARLDVVQSPLSLPALGDLIGTANSGMQLLT